MNGKCVYNLIIGGFKFYGNIQTNTTGPDIKLNIPRNIGLCTKLISCSPYENINYDLHYNSVSYNFQNSYFNTHYFVHYDNSDMLIQSEANITIEHSYFYTRDVSKKAHKKEKLKSLQFKIDNNTSLCFGYKKIDSLKDYISNYDRDVKIIACTIGKDVYYNNFPNTDMQAIIYYMQIIPYSDIFINDGALFTDELHIGKCIIKRVSKTTSNCFVIAENKNNYLVAVIK